MLIKLREKWVTRLKIIFQPFPAVERNVSIIFSVTLWPKSWNINSIFHNKCTFVHLNDLWQFRYFWCSINVLKFTLIFFLPNNYSVSKILFCVIVYEIFVVHKLLSIQIFYSKFGYYIWNSRHLKNIYETRVWTDI